MLAEILARNHIEIGGSSALLVNPIRMPETGAAEPGRFFYDGESYPTLYGTAIGGE
jgi:hypothetical protein